MLGGVDLPWAEAAKVHEDALRGPLPTDDTVEAAIESWSRALECWPRHVVARRARARLLAFRGDLEGAREEFRRAVEDEPYFLGARLDLARVLATVGRWEEAASERAEVERRLDEIANAAPPDPYESVLFVLTPEERAEIGR
jgi:tetratricopeptide (TPR) repeat protein